jgi:hypothetical protein
MAKYLTLGAAVALFLGIGLWNSLRSGLGNCEPGDVVQQRLSKVPMAIGPWKGQDQPIHEKHLRTAHAEAYLNRSYTETSSGRIVNVLVMYGEPGDLGAHDPKVCYGSAGHELAGPYSQKVVPGGVPNTFWSARFEKPNALPFEVLWAWGTGGDWQAPDSPRLAFAGEGRIFKVYVQKPADDPDALDGTLIPELLEALRTAITQPLLEHRSGTP